MRRCFLLALTLGSSPLACQERERLPVGSPEIRTSHIREHTDTLAVLFLRDGRELPVGIVTLRTTPADTGAHAVIVREEHMWANSGTLLDADSFVVLRNSLAPVSQRSWNSERVQALRFEDRRVRGSRNASPIDVTLETPAFYNNSMDLVLSSLPLRPGYAVQIPVFDSEHGTVAQLHVQVRGAEEARTADGGGCLAWRVEVSGGSNQGTYWIARQTRALVRYEKGSSGVRLARQSACPERLT